ncbi:ABC transporter substrate-binding protein [Micromonospora sp. NPDC049051]|uniref:ABC transporter substrate-binding protein n=1 Tax=unclassified Micromonospora TaxID=2617518 RepID=UPI003710A6EF
MKRFASVTLIATMALAVGACNSDSSGSDGTNSGKLRVTTIGLCNEQIAWGIDQKMFDGLDVELVPVQSGAAALAALTAGETDVAFVNALTSFTAIGKGEPVQIVGNSALSTEQANGLIVNAKSGITSVRQLQGKTIAINGLNSIGHAMTNYWIEQEVGEKSTAKFTQLPFDQLLPAVVGNRVEAAQVTASQVSEGQKAGTTVSLGNPFFVRTGPIPTAFYLAKSEWVQKNPDTAKRFADGMQKASESANDPANDDKRFPVLAKFCKKPVDIIKQEPESDYEGKVSMDPYRALVKVLVDQKLIPGETKWEDVVPAFARQA